jgi:hypothetical protein
MGFLRIWPEASRYILGGVLVAGRAISGRDSQGSLIRILESYTLELNEEHAYIDLVLN